MFVGSVLSDHSWARQRQTPGVSPLSGFTACWCSWVYSEEILTNIQVELTHPVGSFPLVMLKKHNIFASKDIILLAGDLCTCLSPSEDCSPQRLLFSVLQYKFSGEGCGKGSGTWGLPVVCPEERAAVCSFWCPWGSCSGGGALLEGGLQKTPSYSGSPWPLSRCLASCCSFPQAWASFLSQARYSIQLSCHYSSSGINSEHLFWGASGNQRKKLCYLFIYNFCSAFLFFFYLILVCTCVDTCWNWVLPPSWIQE